MQEYDAKADVWSVGCIFFEMLVGGPPFRGSNPRELFQNIRTKSLQVPPEVPLGRDSMEILQRVSTTEERKRERELSVRYACHLSLITDVATQFFCFCLPNPFITGSRAESATPCIPRAALCSVSSSQPAEFHGQCDRRYVFVGVWKCFSPLPDARTRI
jgi:serine/threonine protein kinase